MICYLTSSPILYGTEILDPSNGFVETLRQDFPPHCRALFVCSDPEGWQETDFFAASVRRGFEAAGFAFEAFWVLDSRNQDSTRQLAAESNFIILAGGHVPTQNRFFRRIRLKETLEAYDGLLLGISAGSMNSAATVYSQPEEPGEALDPAYERFLPGLGLTDLMLLPHYQAVRDSLLDGLRIIEDITLPDSIGKTFYAIPDGSYLLIRNGRPELRGEAYRIRDGKIEPIPGAANQ